MALMSLEIAGCYRNDLPFLQPFQPNHFDNNNNPDTLFQVCARQRCYLHGLPVTALRVRSTEQDETLLCTEHHTMKTPAVQLSRARQTSVGGTSTLPQHTLCSTCSPTKNAFPRPNKHMQAVQRLQWVQLGDTSLQNVDTKLIP